MRFFLSFFLLILSACTSMQTLHQLQNYEITLADANPQDTTVTEVRAKKDKAGREAKILSAFYGLDDALPIISNKAICKGAGKNDGMPVIFSHEIDLASMQAGDFQITTASGKIGKITCVTLAPADDKGELRTVLIAGHYGSIEDQPVKVEIIGNLLSIDKSVNFKAAQSSVIPLEKGPSMILAERLPPEQFELGKKATALPWGGGSGCPIGTKQIVRVTWVGGITKPGGDEADDKERLQYKVTVKQGSKTIKVIPFALADLGDGDNNHKLCLDVDGEPKSVFFAAGFLTDPRDDLNPITEIEVTR